VGWGILSIPPTTGSLNRRVTIQAGLGKKQELISKITRAKGAGGVSQVVECLSSAKPWVQTPVLLKKIDLNLT
jgi:hypothetical protein